MVIRRQNCSNSGSNKGGHTISRYTNRRSQISDEPGVAQVHTDSRLYAMAGQQDMLTAEWRTHRMSAAAYYLLTQLAPPIKQDDTAMVNNASRTANVSPLYATDHASAATAADMLTAVSVESFKQP